MGSKKRTVEEKRRIVEAIKAKKPKTAKETKKYCGEQGIGYSTFCAWRISLTKLDEEFSKVTLKEQSVKLANENKLILEMISEMELKIENLSKSIERMKTDFARARAGFPEVEAIELLALVSVDHKSNLSVIKYTPKKHWNEGRKFAFYEMTNNGARPVTPGVYAWRGQSLPDENGLIGDWQEAKLSE